MLTATPQTFPTLARFPFQGSLPFSSPLTSLVTHILLTCFTYIVITSCDGFKEKMILPHITLMHDIIHQFVHLQTDFFVVSFVESHEGLHFWILRLTHHSICHGLAEPNGFHQIVGGLAHGIRDRLGSDQAGMMRSLEWMNLISFRSELYNTRHHSPKYRYTSHQLEGCPIL